MLYAAVFYLGLEFWLILGLDSRILGFLPAAAVVYHIGILGFHDGILEFYNTTGTVRILIVQPCPILYPRNHYLLLFQ